MCLLLLTMSYTVSLPTDTTILLSHKGNYTNMRNSPINFKEYTPRTVILLTEKTWDMPALNQLFLKQKVPVPVSF